MDNPYISQGNINQGEPPMNLRDWFAGQALAGLSTHNKESGRTVSEHAETLAYGAYMFADAMLLARQQEKG